MLKSFQSFTTKLINNYTYYPQYTFSVFHRYTVEHEWVSFDDEKMEAKLGISNYAQNELRDIIFVEFPKIGTDIKQMEELCKIESIKTNWEIFAPMSGKVVENNYNIKADWDSLAEKTEDVWLVKLKVENPEEIKNLLDKKAYLDHVETVKEKF